jgi:hypothetical protein
MTPEPVPPGIPPAMTARTAAGVLHGMDERTIARWCRIGFVQHAFQPTPGAGTWWIPTAEVARLASVMLCAPDWERAT